MSGTEPGSAIQEFAAGRSGRARDARFDLVALHTELETARRRNRLTWTGVADEIGVSKSLLSRIKNQGHQPSATSLCRIMLWLGTRDILRYTTFDTDPA